MGNDYSFPKADNSLSSYFSEREKNDNTGIYRMKLIDKTDLLVALKQYLSEDFIKKDPDFISSLSDLAQELKDVEGDYNDVSPYLYVMF